MNRGDDGENHRRPEETRETQEKPQMSEPCQTQGGWDRPAFHRAICLSCQKPAQYEGRHRQDEKGERDSEKQRGRLEQGGHGYGVEAGLEAIQVSR